MFYSGFSAEGDEDGGFVVVEDLIPIVLFRPNTTC